MITTEDQDILESVETKLIASAIKRTILSRFRSSNTQLYKDVVTLTLDYVSPKTNERYIESGSIVDIFINRQYRNLKKQLKEHYVVRKYTKILCKSFAFNYLKRYHFIIENYSTYYDFYLDCEGLNRSPDIHYNQYKLYISDKLLTNK